MDISLGIKSDPIEYRYSFDWLFGLMEDLSVRYLQLGSIHEYYWVEGSFFKRLQDRAARHGVIIRSVFSSHRELGGWLSVEPEFEEVAHRTWERLIEIAAWVGAETAGAAIGSVPRDRMETKQAGIQRFVRHMHELLAIAKSHGLKALVIESMSALAEPPTMREEITAVMEEMATFHCDHRETTVPLYLCPDISHGYVNEDGVMVEDNYSLFEHAIPYAVEFHIKNTDERFESTFGFGPETRSRGIVDLERFRAIIDANRQRFPLDHVVGYFEINGPKFGRDYSDKQLRHQLISSIEAIQKVLF